VVTPELARALTEVSSEIGRQVGLLINRRGIIEQVLVGSDREITIPSLTEYRIGRKRLRGLRFIHTHLKDEPLTREDLTDLALLRLDLMVALGVRDGGLPSRAFVAYLLPPNPEGKVYEIFSPVPIHELHLDCEAFVRALEEEMGRTVGGVAVEEGRDRAILIGVGIGSRQTLEESSEELRDLARTSHVEVLDAVVQCVQRLDPRSLMGIGKLREVIIRALQLGANLLIFDRELSPAQAKAITDLTDLRVIDRSQLILDIFARRAHSRDGKVQVELAQLKYLLPRLTGKGTAMSRLTGGIGGRGPGEMKLEIDRRRVRERIAHLEHQLRALSRGRHERRRLRVKRGLPILSIVGYTNAGKSTLLNALTKSETFTEDLLFATLDTASRRLRFPREREAIITDTVGFLRHLPPDLVGAFRATLDELQDADLLIHVVDISHPRFEEQMAAVEKILGELDLGRIPRLLVFNKIDRVDPQEVKALARRFEAVPISALDPATLGPLLAAIEDRVFFSHRRFEGESV
jgi:GTP-binding protein HflX